MNTNQTIPQGHDCAYPPDCRTCRTYTQVVTKARRRWLASAK